MHIPTRRFVVCILLAQGFQYHRQLNVHTLYMSKKNVALQCIEISDLNAMIDLGNMTWRVLDHPALHPAR